MSIRAPVVLRDVNVFLKKHQVGEGTYGSVFVGQDKITKDIVALKRINTEQEENGFPITAIREVKILKALKHENIVTLKEIVTSKGEYKSSVRCVDTRRFVYPIGLEKKAETSVSRIVFHVSHEPVAQFLFANSKLRPQVLSRSE
jgi:serine/threonine protein kinase